ncbi:MAG TPA: hypothetical protein VM716_12290 [Gemmatimonadales bacterium]|nr:hypothetical protein [Gemmatimonadales bacterium]
MTPRVLSFRKPAQAPSGPRRTPDRLLVEQMTKGDETAFHELFARFRGTVYATAYGALHDPEQVEATVADTFKEARCTAAAFLASNCSVSGWLTHLTRLCIAARERA